MKKSDRKVTDMFYKVDFYFWVLKYGSSITLQTPDSWPTTSASVKAEQLINATF